MIDFIAAVKAVFTARYLKTNVTNSLATIEVKTAQEHKTNPDYELLDGRLVIEKSFKVNQGRTGPYADNLYTLECTLRIRNLVTKTEIQIEIDRMFAEENDSQPRTVEYSVDDNGILEVGKDKFDQILIRGDLIE